MQLLMLILSILALFIGPLLYQSFKTRTYWYRLLDGFVVVMITGIVCLEVLPEVLAHHPLSGMILLGAGLMGPTVLEHLFHRMAHQVHWTALFIGTLGLVAHAFVDGVILSEISSGAFSSESMLGWGIILHRIPVGLTIWMLLLPRLGRERAVITLGMLIAGTFFGFGYEAVMGTWSSGEGLILFQALAAGSILHVVLHRPHESHREQITREQSRLYRYGEGLGNVIGLGALVLVALLHTAEAGRHAHGLELLGGISNTFWALALESAPALLLAYLVGGMMIAFLPGASIRWMQRGAAPVRSVKGVVVGLPLPICTCGVLPLYRSLIKRGAPPTAAMAFLIATPELGFDALLISIPLLGGDMTVIRLVAAAAIALTVGWAIGGFVERSEPTAATPSNASAPGAAAPVKERIQRGLREGFGSLVDDTAPWILVGLLIAALAEPLLQQGWLQALSPSVEVVLFALLGLPVYVCASGATPIVAVLLMNSVSPGAALAFLLTGPATNISTYGILSQVHNRKTALLFGILTTACAVALGYLVNLGTPYIDLLTGVDFDAEQSTWLQRIALVLLLLVFLASLLRRGARAFFAEVTSGFSLAGSHDHHQHEHDHDHHQDGHGTNGKTSTDAASSNGHSGREEAVPAGHSSDGNEGSCHCNHCVT